MGEAQAWSDVLGPTGTIPRDNFKSWSLFLICNPEWLSAERNDALYRLYANFKEFGRAIGDDNEAIWFWKSTTSDIDPHLGEKVDVERGAKFCKAYGIKPSSTPAVLVTTAYPDLGTPTGEFAEYDLGKLDSNEIAETLAKITDQLQQGRVNEPSDSLFVRLLVAAQRVVQSNICAWSVKINSGPLQADYDPCKK